MPENNARRRALDSLDVKQRFDANLARIDGLEAFDASLGVETSSPVEPWEIQEADDTTLVNNSRYSPTPVCTIRQAIEAATVDVAAVDPAAISFVDYGSGKGRVLLVAAEYPFKKIIGVEFSQELCTTARRNIERLPQEPGPRPAVEIHRQDARDFEIPEDAGFFYFYEPFSPAVTAVVLDRIEASLARTPRAAVLCFVGSALLPVLDGRTLWSQAGAALASPDDPYFETRLYRNTGTGSAVGVDVDVDVEP